MTIDRNEIEQMTKFMTALSDPEAVAKDNAKVGETAVSEMKAILQRFHGATSNVIAEKSFDLPLRESLITERTANGARIGNWDIIVRQSGKRKYYDVMHVPSQETIITDLLLYEAAHGLVRKLNEGEKINSNEIIELLRAEQQYAGAVHDMILFKHHLSKAPDGPKAGIFEARYGAAKRVALTAKERVSKLCETF